MSGSVFVGLALAYVFAGRLALFICEHRLGLRYADDGDFIFKWSIWPVTLLIGWCLHVKDPTPPKEESQ